MTRGPAAAPSTRSPLWLSHHTDEHLDRCATVGGRLVCRRCLVLYPVAFTVLAVGLAAGDDGRTALDPWILALLPLPAVVEWWLEHLGRIAYSVPRQVTTSVPLGVALGRGLTRYLHDPGDLAFWLMTLVYGGGCLAIALWRFLDERAP